MGESKRAFHRDLERVPEFSPTVAWSSDRTGVRRKLKGREWLNRDLLSDSKVRGAPQSDIRLPAHHRRRRLHRIADGYER